MIDRLANQVEYYSRNLADPGLLDKAVIVEGTYCCVPVGGQRRGGDTFRIMPDDERHRVFDALSGKPGFPNLRVEDFCVRWGDDAPKVPVEGGLWVFRHDWAFGLYYGYSLNAIIFQLGRHAAVAVEPGFYEIEAAETGGTQIRSHRQAVTC